VSNPATRALCAPSFPIYLQRLRVLGAWWCRGSSGVGPQQLLPHEPWDAPPAHIVRKNRDTRHAPPADLTLRR
jgi:hypothetical protein